MATKKVASAAQKSAKIIARKIWGNTPKSIRRSGGSAAIVIMAANLLAAPQMNEIGKCAVQDMAHELSNYTWDPFDGFCA